MVVLLLLLLVVGWIVNGFFGNPFSKMLVKHSVNNYLAENYADRDFEIDEVLYNFKTGEYDAKIISPSSIDTHFIIAVPFYKVKNDSYEDAVLSGWNTSQRIENEYRQLVDEVFARKDFPLVSEIDFGTIEFKAANDTLEGEADYGIVMGDLELDKQYDIKEIAKQAGHIIYYAQDETLTFERASELLLILTEELEQADIPFYAIDFSLEPPKEEEQEQIENDEGIYTSNFLYEDINQKDLAKRLENAHNELMDSYQNIK